MRIVRRTRSTSELRAISDKHDLRATRRSNAGHIRVKCGGNFCGSLDLRPVRGTLYTNHFVILSTHYVRQHLQQSRDTRIRTLVYRKPLRRTGRSARQHHQLQSHVALVPQRLVCIQRISKKPDYSTAWQSYQQRRRSEYRRRRTSLPASESRNRQRTARQSHPQRTSAEKATSTHAPYPRLRGATTQSQAHHRTAEKNQGKTRSQEGLLLSGSSLRRRFCDVAFGRNIENNSAR